MKRETLIQSRQPRRPCTTRSEGREKRSETDVRDERLSLLFPLRSLLFSCGDDRNRQNLGVGDVRSHITAMPQAFHQHVNHDESGYYVASDRRLLLAMMDVGWATAIVPEVSMVVN